MNVTVYVARLLSRMCPMLPVLQIPTVSPATASCFLLGVGLPNLRPFVPLSRYFRMLVIQPLECRHRLTPSTATSLLLTKDDCTNARLFATVKNVLGPRASAPTIVKALVCIIKSDAAFDVLFLRFKLNFVVHGRLPVASLTPID